MERIDKILSDIISRKKWADRFSCEYLKSKWEECVGKQIASHTKPLFIKNEKLFIAVDSPIWANQLNFLQNEIKNKINSFLNKKIVKEIVFKLKVN